MKRLLVLTIFLSSLIAEQTYRLKDNETVIKGTKVSEDDLTITIQTRFGKMTLNKSEILQSKYKVKLKTGDMLTGLKESEDNESIILKTAMGSITLPKSEIEYMNEVDKTSMVTTSSSASGETSFYEQYMANQNKSSGLASLPGLLFGTKKLDKSEDFSKGDALIDHFFNPTGHVLEPKEIYLSGFSAGMGITEKIMFTTQWISWLPLGQPQDFNLRLKAQLYKSEDMDKSNTFAVGAHLRSNYSNCGGLIGACEDYKWVSGSYDVKQFTYEDVCIKQGVREDGEGGTETYCEDEELQVSDISSETRYYGGYIGAFDEEEIIDETEAISVGDPYSNQRNVSMNVTTNSFPTFNLFTAFTHQKATSSGGQMSHTFGGSVTVPIGINNPGDWKNYPIKLFYDFDMDIFPRLKLIVSGFYDPTYITFSDGIEYGIDENSFENENDNANDYGSVFGDNYDRDAFGAIKWLSNSPISQPTGLYGMHGDIGVMIRASENFRIGIHFQRPFVGFYWKF